MASKREQREKNNEKSSKGQIKLRFIFICVRSLLSIQRLELNDISAGPDYATSLFFMC